MDERTKSRVDHWRRYLEGWNPAFERAHDRSAVQVCRLAVEAMAFGTYGVGALLVDAEGEVVIEGHNRVRSPGKFRSDLHAEMVVANEYEALGLARARARSFTLVTSLESCPMCLTRLIVAGVGTVHHVADDPVGGMVSRRQHLPPVFRTIAEHHGQVWTRADCSDDLREAAFRIWDESRNQRTDPVIQASPYGVSVASIIVLRARFDSRTGDLEVVDFTAGSDGAEPR